MPLQGSESMILGYRIQHVSGGDVTQNSCPTTRENKRRAANVEIGDGGGGELKRAELRRSMLELIVGVMGSHRLLVKPSPICILGYLVPKSARCANFK